MTVFAYTYANTINSLYSANSQTCGLVSIGDGKKRKYYWDLEEYKNSKVSGTIRYLKGLGSLDLADWEYVMNNKQLSDIEETEDSKDKLEMAFGDSSELRKKWLSNK